SVPSFVYHSIRSSLPHTPASDIYTLSLHDAFRSRKPGVLRREFSPPGEDPGNARPFDARAPVFELFGQRFQQLRSRKHAPDEELDRKSTRLNSSHGSISYAVFCLKKKKSGHVSDA